VVVMPPGKGSGQPIALGDLAARPYHPPKIVVKPPRGRVIRLPPAKAEPVKPAAAPRAARPLGRMFSSRRYNLIERISRRSRSPVFKARDTVLDTVVAIKFLPLNVVVDPTAVRLFKHEASVAMRLSHENIVRLHNLEVEAGRIFLVMEYVEGCDFRQIIGKAGKLSLDTVLEIAESSASALSYAHERGVLHKDLKPENLMLNRDSILKIVDFGIAEPIRVQGSDGEEVFIEGTPAYMSPEQAMGLSLDARTDIYSLGATLFELLAGTPLFPLEAAIEAVPDLEPAPMPRDIPAPVGEVLVTAVAKSRKERWSNAAEFYEAFARAAAAHLSASPAARHP
jgi:serine/threonine-protein kinase